jgi:peptidoglycan LD-endopeptidase LytH
MSEKALSSQDLLVFMQAQQIEAELLHLDVPTPTVEAAAQAVGVHSDHIVKSILFLVDQQPVLTVTSGRSLVERRAIAQLYGVSRKRVKLASRAEVLYISGYEPGAMPPFGHRQPLPTLVDRRVIEYDQVYAGGGDENALLRIRPVDILNVTGVCLANLITPSLPEAGSAATRFLVAGLLVILMVAVGLFFLDGGHHKLNRSANVVAWLRDSQSHQDWAIQAGERCGEAPFIYPTNGFIGFLWDDSFRPGHRHQGLDIFGGGGLNETPVIAAYSGYLSRLSEWKSTVIIRVPSDPLQPSRQIWLYYTHMADPDGNSFISAEFPPDTNEVYVEAGTLIGYQGNYSGSALNPTGIHLHFSIVLDDGRGKFRNELEIENTLDPSPYLGLPLNARTTKVEIPLCTP